MNKDAQQHGLVRSIMIPLIILSLALAGWYYVVQDDTTLPEPPEPEVTTKPGPTEDTSSSKRQELFDNQIEPELERAGRRNREALQNLIQRINEIFAGYKQGVKPFSEDITSMGTRFWALWEWTGGKDDVRGYVHGKFEKHIFSEKQLEQDIESALKGYEEDIIANRNRLLSNVRAAVQKGDVQVPHLPELDEYSRQVTNTMETYASNKATDSALNGVATFAVSEVIAFTCEKIAYVVIARVGTSAATSAATTTGTSATGAGSGAAGGSTVGPAGTAIGFGVGLVIGFAVDWYMTENFRAKLEKEMTGYLDTLKEGLIEGTREEGEDTPGIEQVLGEYTRTMNRAQRKQMRIAITGEEQ